MSSRRILGWHALDPHPRRWGFDCRACNPGIRIRCLPYGVEVPNGSETPVFDFAGFFRPVKQPPDHQRGPGRKVRTGEVQLGRRPGPRHLRGRLPASGTVPADPNALLDAIETVTAGASGLSYDAVSDQYTYVWKTEKAWSGQTRQLVLKLTDGSEHTANFQFRE